MRYITVSMAILCVIARLYFYLIRTRKNNNISFCAANNENYSRTWKVNISAWYLGKLQ